MYIYKKKLTINHKIRADAALSSQSQPSTKHRENLMLPPLSPAELISHAKCPQLETEQFTSNCPHLDPPSGMPTRLPPGPAHLPHIERGMPSRRQVSKSKHRLNMRNIADDRSHGAAHGQISRRHHHTKKSHEEQITKRNISQIS